MGGVCWELLRFGGACKKRPGQSKKWVSPGGRNFEVEHSSGILVYAEQGVGDKLVTTGTYALVRHPGVLWYAIFLVGMILASGRWLALLAAPVWLLIDVLHVWIQEKVFFNQMSPEYEQYKQQTPMLIPTRRSIARCLQTFRVR